MQSKELLVSFSLLQSIHFPARFMGELVPRLIFGRVGIHP